MSVVSVSGLQKTYSVSKKDKKASGSSSAHDLRDVSFEVQAGEIFTLLGPSGCGKSTTLRSIAGLETPDGGEISVGGRLVFSADEKKVVDPQDRHLSMVFQSYAIWPHMSVRDNVAFPLEVESRKRRLPRKEIQERVRAVLKTVGLHDYIDRSAVKLSGGQQQRLALARAIVTEPELVLLDEPLSNLDAKLRESMRLELKRLQQQLGLTSIYVTHDQGEALAMSSRIAVMNEGKIVQLGTPREIYEAPNSPFVAEFVGTSNMLKGTVSAVDESIMEVQTKAGTLRARIYQDVAKGSEVTLLIRPENIDLRDLERQSQSSNGWRGRVRTGAYVGEAVEYVADVNGVDIRCRANPREGGRTNTDVFLEVDPDNIYALPF